MENIIRLETSLGNIDLTLRPNSAPKTVEHIKKIVKDGLYNGCCFYRSDFVIQCGLQRPNGSGVQNPHPPLAVNETMANERISNNRGTVSVAHWDVPDCGNSEFFINIIRLMYFYVKKLIKALLTVANMPFDMFKV